MIEAVSRADEQQEGEQRTDDHRFGDHRLDAEVPVITYCPWIQKIVLNINRYGTM
jgi:hypothetical protein